MVGLDTLSPPQPTTSPSPPRWHRGPVGVPMSRRRRRWRQGQPSPVTAKGVLTSIDSVKPTTGALDASILPWRTRSTPSIPAGDYGSGATVGTRRVGQNRLRPLTDITNFACVHGIPLGEPASHPRCRSTGAGSIGGNTVEAELDIETVLSLAPQANIEVYEGGAPTAWYNVLNKIIGDDSAKIVSDSWTNGCEAYMSSSLQTSENTLLQEAADRRTVGLRGGPGTGR